MCRRSSRGDLSDPTPPRAPAQRAAASSRSFPANVIAPSSLGRSMKFQPDRGVSLMEQMRDLELSRRIFLKGSAATAAATLTLGGTSVLAFADATVINIVSDGDTNVTDWWTNTLKPQFEAANPGLSLNIVITRADGGNDVVAQRVVAAKQTNTD